MIRRSWRLLLAALVIVLLIVALGVWVWVWTPPAPPASLEHSNLDGGAPLTSVTPATSIKTRIALAVTAEDMLTDKQLLAISKDASARIIQVVLPKDDCVLQQKTFQ
ncbi:virulence, partial [Pseudomonas syringae pv. pisi str. 1704B]